LKKKGSKSSS